MTLHLGSVPSLIRKDELEHVFGRFGRCTVRMFDGYAFADYNFRGDAEKALRSLKGRIICGESIHLSWSKRQPKPVQGFAGVARDCNVQYERGPDRGDIYVHNQNYAKARRDYAMNDKVVNDGGGNHKFAGLRDDRGRFNHFDQGRSEYVPITCYRCGAAGHKIRDCPGGDDLHTKNSYRTALSHDNDESRGTESRPIGKSQPSSRHTRSARQHGVDVKGSHLDNNDFNGRNSPVSDEIERNKSKVYRRKRQRERKDQTVETHADKQSRILASPCQPDRTSPNLSTLPGFVKPLPDSKCHSSSRLPKNCTRSVTPELVTHPRSLKPLSDSRSLSAKPYSRSGIPISPELDPHSRSMKPLSDLRSHSRSRSPAPYSRSGSPISKSTSTQSRCRSARSSSRSRSWSSSRSWSRSRRRSRSPSSSLSISVGQSVPSLVILNGSSGGSPIQSKVMPSEARHRDEPEVREDNPSSENRVEPCVSECMDDMRSDQSQEVLVEGERLEPDLKSEIPRNSKDTEVSLNGFVNCMQDCVPSEDVSFSSSLKSKIQKLNCDGCSNSTVDPVSCEVEVVCPNVVEDDNKDMTAGVIAAEKLYQNVELQNGDALEMEKSLESVIKSDLIASSERFVDSHLSISTEELCRVLKHYGLELPEEDERHWGVEDYFGCARLWPWEMVFYRRLKKGSISIENYAKRVAQNEAFRITDKYIRSSSGWGEMIEE